MGAAPKALLWAPAGRRNHTRAAPGFGGGTRISAAIAAGIESARASKPSKIGKSRPALRIVVLPGEGSSRVLSGWFHDCVLADPGAARCFRRLRRRLNDPPRRSRYR